MRRTLNVRFLLWLVAGTLVCTGGVALAHHLQYKRLPLALLKQAQRAEDQGEIARADSYLTQYLNFAPDDTRTRARLARLRLAQHKDGSIKLQERLFFFLDDTV